MCVDFYTYDVRECRAKRGATVRTNGHPKQLKTVCFQWNASAFIKAGVICVEILIVQVILNNTQRITEAINVKCFCDKK